MRYKGFIGHFGLLKNLKNLFSLFKDSLLFWGRKSCIPRIINSHFQNPYKQVNFRRISYLSSIHTTKTIKSQLLYFITNEFHGVKFHHWTRNILAMYEIRKNWCWLHSTSTKQKKTWTTSMLLLLKHLWSQCQTNLPTHFNHMMPPRYGLMEASYLSILYTLMMKTLLTWEIFHNTPKDQIWPKFYLQERSI